MTTLLNDLDELIDILGDIVFEDVPSSIDDATALDIIETAMQLMDNYVNENPAAITEPDFHDTMLDEIKSLYDDQLDTDITDEDDDLVNDLIDDAFEIFIDSFQLNRSYIVSSSNDTPGDDVTDQITKQIDYLRSKPQPPQRTKEWFEFRHTIISASIASKAFGSQSEINQLIYEKCRPLKIDDKPTYVNINAPFHWGQKYEPVSVLIYEHVFKTKVEDFGCLRHDKYSFLGASPDGIIVDTNSDRYGRMLEIKNIVNREIDGNPKKEYWVQMQLQMEVCDLDQCDFLETKFVEYENYAAYCEDVTDKQKGFMMYFCKSDGNPTYIYKPIDLVDLDEIAKWEEDTIEQYQHLTWIKNCYWKLDIISCVLVLRNRKWFEDNVATLDSIWKIIEQERITGYEHRAPKKRVKNNTTTPFVFGCVLKLNDTI
jgi:putative phage-type endonuclease